MCVCVCSERRLKSMEWNGPTCKSEWTWFGLVWFGCCHRNLNMKRRPSRKTRRSDRFAQRFRGGPPAPGAVRRSKDIASAALCASLRRHAPCSRRLCSRNWKPDQPLLPARPSSANELHHVRTCFGPTAFGAANETTHHVFQPPALASIARTSHSKPAPSPPAQCSAHASSHAPSKQPDTSVADPRRRVAQVGFCQNGWPSCSLGLVSGEGSTIPVPGTQH